MQHYDVIVIGAGPAGCIAARQLALGGAKVLLVEKRPFPREKVCGCCINEKAVAAIRTLGLGEQLEALHPGGLERLRLRFPGREGVFDLPPTVTVSRGELDAMLATAAEFAGATFLDGMTAKVIAGPPLAHRDGEWEVALTGKRHVGEIIRARLVIAADGLGGGSLQQISGFETKTSRKSYLGLQGFFEIDDAPGDELLMHCGQGGYVGCARLGDGRLNVAAAVDPHTVKRVGPQRACERILRDAGATQLAKHASKARWRGTPLLSQRRPVIARDGIYVVGDAAGYVEPFTGEGIGWALRGGAALADIVMDHLNAVPGNHAARWSRRYAEQLGGEQRRCRWLTSALRTQAVAHLGLRLAIGRPSLLRQTLPGLIGSNLVRKERV